jgi:hypothetical protein
MPKSRGHKKTKKQTFREEVLPLNERARQALMWQLESFKKKFGRDWQAGDPLFFDPKSDVPKAYPEGRMRRELLELMQKARTPPEIIYAHKKTDLLLMDDDVEVPADRRKEWNDAIAEYFALERKAKSQRS